MIFNSNSQNEIIYQDNVVKEMEINLANKYRTVTLFDEVTRDSIFKCLYWIDKIVGMDKIKGKKEPIIISLDCYGGFCYHGLALISRIEQLRDEGYEIIGICKGVACSMGSAILNVCSKRKMYRYSMVLIHSVSSGQQGTIQELRESLEETERLWKVLKKLYLKYTKIPENVLEDMITRKIDWVLDAEKTLEYNVVDEVL